MMTLKRNIFILFISILFSPLYALAQQPTVSAKIDATQITIGDQVKLFLEANLNAKQNRLQWANIPDTFNNLEVVEKGKIDTIKNGDFVTYKQRLLVTGFDSGSFKIPPTVFSVIPNNGAAYNIQTDSFQLSVNTVPVDTTKGIKGIKEIIAVKSSWRDYIGYIIGGILLVGVIIFMILYFIKNKKQKPVIVPKAPIETSQQKALRLLAELDEKKLWQSNHIKEYYTSLTEILRNYIEERFQTRALETTTEELLQIARRHPEMNLYYQQLANTLATADMAKFAKAQPLPHEHTNALEMTKQFVLATQPVIKETTENKP